MNKKKNNSLYYKIINYSYNGYYDYLLGIFIKKTTYYFSFLSLTAFLLFLT
uniref:Uncharacterized protein n=1 Tax=Arsenophonus nasoniae TaxID=638 RepID=D2TWF3_9GAMM|nr:hypothetical protein ARN_03780 [Arsenophonus nasoniae]